MSPGQADAYPMDSLWLRQGDSNIAYPRFATNGVGIRKSPAGSFRRGFLSLAGGAV